MNIFNLSETKIPNSIVVNLYYKDKDGNDNITYGFNDPKEDSNDFSIYEYDGFGNKTLLGIADQWSHLTKEQEGECTYLEHICIKSNDEYVMYKCLYEIIKDSFSDLTFYNFDNYNAFTGANLLKSLLAYEINVLKQIKHFVVQRIEDSSDCEDCGYSFSTIFNLYESNDSGELSLIESWGDSASCFGVRNGYSFQPIDYILILYGRRPYGRRPTLNSDQCFNFSDEECFKYLSKLLEGKCIITYEEELDNEPEFD